jgi:hypothetical protein
MHASQNRCPANGVVIESAHHILPQQGIINAVAPYNAVGYWELMSGDC